MKKARRFAIIAVLMVFVLLMTTACSSGDAYTDDTYVDDTNVDNTATDNNSAAKSSDSSNTADSAAINNDSNSDDSAAVNNDSNSDASEDDFNDSDISDNSDDDTSFIGDGGFLNPGAIVGNWVSMMSDHGIYFTDEGEFGFSYIFGDEPAGSYQLGDESIGMRTYDVYYYDSEGVSNTFRVYDSNHIINSNCEMYVRSGYEGANPAVLDNAADVTLVWYGEEVSYPSDLMFVITDVDGWPAYFAGEGEEEDKRNSSYLLPGFFVPEAITIMGTDPSNPNELVNDINFCITISPFDDDSVESSYWKDDLSSFIEYGEDDIAMYRIPFEGDRFTLKTSGGVDDRAEEDEFAPMQGAQFDTLDPYGTWYENGNLDGVSFTLYEDGTWEINADARHIEGRCYPWGATGLLYMGMDNVNTYADITPRQGVMYLTLSDNVNNDFETKEGTITLMREEESTHQGGSRNEIYSADEYFIGTWLVFDYENSQVFDYGFELRTDGTYVDYPTDEFSRVCNYTVGDGEIKVIDSDGEVVRSYVFDPTYELKVMVGEDETAYISQ